MENRNYLFITHRAYDDNKMKMAGIDGIIDFVSFGGVFIIEHPLDSDFDVSFVKKIKDGVREVKRRVKVFPKRQPFRWVSEILLNFFWARWLVKKEGISVIFSVDPLNTVSVLPLKLFYPKTRIYFFSADYSKKRFQNSFFNYLYEFIHKLSVEKSDKVFVVSRRMRDFLERRNPRKIIFLPNSPYLSQLRRLPYERKNKFSLVISSRKIEKEIDLKKIFEAMRILKNYFPEIQLNLLSKKTDTAADLIEEYGLEKNVSISGFLSHKKALDIITKSYIGISWYKDGVSQFYWGDSLKIREYAFCGLPVVSDGITSTAEEMQRRGCGFIVGSSEEMAQKIKQLLEDEKMYKQMRQNSIKWAKDTDKRKILKNIFKKINCRPFA